jgi:PPOX class probable F420-dependent enzyme
VKLADAFDRYRSLLEAPSPATLGLYNRHGDIVLSPVWFRADEEAFEVVMAIGDRKVEHLRGDPRCVLLIFEATPPFRGVSVRGRARIQPDTDAETRLAIASRYLGHEMGRRYADPARRPPGVVVRLSTESARAWDLQDSLPSPSD